jgi:integrase
MTDVSRYLGHASIQVTYGTYAHFIPNSTSTAVAVLDATWAAE